MKRLKPNEKYSALQAIKQQCLDCCSGVFNSVRECPNVDCPLWYYRTGTYAGRKKKRPMTEEQKKALVERLQKGKENVKKTS